MNGSSKYEDAVSRCQELEVNVRLWMAANDAKAERIRELEHLCARLQQRVARMGRRDGSGSKHARLERMRNAR